MIRTLKSAISWVILFVFITGCNPENNEIHGLNAREKLAEGFKVPPDSIQTAVYWYWISDNISRDGVVKDLHAMKTAGISRAFIGNIGLSDVPYGKVKMLSEAWWEILHLALKTATALDIEIGIFNSELWGDVDGINVKSRKFGKGMVLFGMDMSEALAMINCVPDCKLPEDNSIHYGHRTLGNGEIYFITNQTNKEKVIAPEFRVSGMQPELWEATTGYIRDLPAYVQKGSVTAVPLKLAPYESVFIVFSKPAEGNGADVEANYPKSELIADFKTPWTVNFNAAERGPEKAVIFEELIDWTNSKDKRIKYYSGTAYYYNTFQFDKHTKNEKINIDLGELTAMAKVTINGKYAGGVWTAPYRLEITELVKEGENDLKIEVVNTWVNRIIGDMHLPEEERKVWAPHLPYNADSPLQASGLMGPVQIRVVR